MPVPQTDHAVPVSFIRHVEVGNHEVPYPNVGELLGNMRPPSAESDNTYRCLREKLFAAGPKE